MADESVYSAELDTFETVVDGTTDVGADWANKVLDVCRKLEAALGPGVTGGRASLAAWLTELQNIVT